MGFLSNKATAPWAHLGEVRPWDSRGSEWGTRRLGLGGYGIAGLGLSGGKRPFFKKVLGQYIWGSGGVLGGFGSHKVGLYTSKATISVIFFFIFHTTMMETVRNSGYISIMVV